MSGKNQIEMYNGKAFGVAVSTYGQKRGYLDYRALAEIIGPRILNNTLREATYGTEWNLVSGVDHYGIDGDGNVCHPYDDDCQYIEEYRTYQDYIISEAGYMLLSAYTDEIVYYHEEFDIYIWSVTHFGTSWDYVLTDVKLIKGEY